MSLNLRVSSNQPLEYYIGFLYDLMEINSNLYVNKEINKSAFDSSINSDIPLSIYLKKIIKLADVEISTFHYAIVLLQKFCATTKVFLTKDNCNMLVFTCIFIALKMNEDAIFRDIELAKIGRMSIRRLVKLESELLKALDYKVFM